MSNIPIAGRVQYMPGPWGQSVAAAGAQVEVIDVDPGGSDDVIWSGNTGPDGRFAGTSSEWRDNRNVNAWVVSGMPPRGRWVGKSVPDAADVLLSNWVAGQGVDVALAPAQSAPLREPMDSFARTRLGFADADSFKLVSGNAGLTIGSLAT